MRLKNIECNKIYKRLESVEDELKNIKKSLKSSEINELRKIDISTIEECLSRVSSAVENVGVKYDCARTNTIK